MDKKTREALLVAKRVAGKARGGPIRPFGLYSKAAEVARSLPQAKGSVDQMIAMLRKAGVKPAEIEHAGLPTGKTITREELAQHFEDRAPSLKYTQYGDKTVGLTSDMANRLNALANKGSPRTPEEEQEFRSLMTIRKSQPNIRSTYDDVTGYDGPEEPRYGDYILPGSTNYRERLIHTPGGKDRTIYTVGNPYFGEVRSFEDHEEAKAYAQQLERDSGGELSRITQRKAPSHDDYTSSHWDEPNVIAHIRMTDRIDGPNRSKAEAARWSMPIRQKIADHMGANVSDLGAGSAKYAVDNGLITPEEAASLSNYMGWRNEFRGKKGIDKRILHVEELQSDWAQEGRDRGFRSPDHVQGGPYDENSSMGMAAARLTEVTRRLADQGLGSDERANHPEFQEAERAVRAAREEVSKTPRGPFVQNTQHWTDLALKNVLYEAAAGDYDHVVFSPGQAQADRYGLEKHLDVLHYDPATKTLSGGKNGFWPVRVANVAPEELKGHVGAELATKLMAPENSAVGADGAQYQVLKGDDLRMGGQGMKGYYDNIVPKSVMRLAQYHDPDIKPGSMDLQGSGGEAYQGFSIPVTDKLRQSILKDGNAMFKRGGRVGYASGGYVPAASLPVPNLVTARPIPVRATPTFMDAVIGAAGITDRMRGLTGSGDAGEEVQTGAQTQGQAQSPGRQPSGAVSSFLDMIDRTEGGGDYSTLFGHSQREGNRFAGTDVSNMTLAQLYDFSDPSGEYGQWVKSELARMGQDPRVATPMGRYQIVGSTLRNAAEGMGLSPDTVFTQQTQDAIANYLARQRLARANTPEGKRAQLRSEWEGFKHVSDEDLDRAIAEFEAAGGLFGERQPGQAFAYGGSVGGALEKARAREAVERAGGQIAPSKYLPGVPRQAHAYGGRAKERDDIWWHGSPSGDLRGGTSGLHLGTREAALDALRARIGVPADGSMWDGTKEYGKTLLAGKKTLNKMGKYLISGHNTHAPEEDYYPHEHPDGMPTVGNRVPVDPSWKPFLRPFKIVGPMTNTPWSPHGDGRANAMMKASLTKGNAKNGYYYTNDGEDSGSISAVVPNGSHVEPVDLDNKYADGGEVADLGQARERKQLGQFHKGMMGDIRSGVAKAMEAHQKAVDAGVFEGYQPGDVLKASAGPMRIENLFVRKWKPTPMTLRTFERMGTQPTIIEHEGEKYIPMVRYSTGREGDPDWQQGDAYLDGIKAAGYEKMGGLRAVKADGGIVNEAIKANGRDDGGYVPQKTQKAYKLFRTKADGKLYPLFVNAEKPVPMGKWLEAEEGPQGKAQGKVKSKLGDLAYRPGWHAGDLPVATHIGGKSDPSLKKPDYRPDNHVWAEVEMAADKDWQSVADSRGKGVNAHITDQVPYGGFYRYKTNPNMTGNWLIGGHMKVNRVLSDEEVKAINDQAGTADLPRISKADGGSVTSREQFYSEMHPDLMDEEGKPLDLWHGTPGAAFEAFDDKKIGTRDAGFYGRGHYLTPDHESAQEYSYDDNDNPGSVIGPLHASLKNPFLWDVSDDDKAYATGKKLQEMGVMKDRSELRPWDNLRRWEVDKFTKAAMAAGHDGVIMKTHRGPQEIVVFNPTKIKHATKNSGAFDTTDPNIYKAEGGPVDGSPQAAAGTRAPRSAPGGLPDAGGMGGGAGLLPAQGEAPLEGLPQSVRIPLTGETVTAGADPRIRKVARDYMQSAGLPYNPPTKYAKVDPSRARKIAAAYEAMPHEPDHPLVQASYAQMIKEVMAQYEAAKRAGFKAEFWNPATDEDPYAASPRLATEDVRKNHHMWVYPTSAGYGTGQEITPEDIRQNPMLMDTGERWNGIPVLVNDVFRAIHDYYGHAKEGVGFRADGEENAWRAHASMFSPLARMAMTTETRGQNSWLNYGPHGDKNRTARTEDTVFAPQKIGVLPHWAHHEGAEDFMTPESVIKMADIMRKNGKMDGDLVQKALGATRGNFKRGGIASYQDAPHPKMTGWDWRKLRDVHRDIGEPTEIPSHVEAFGSFMDEMASRAAKGGLTPRDLIKAYVITRASIQRGAVSGDKAREAGLDIPQSVQMIRPEGAMGEWLHTKHGQRYLDQAERGIVDDEAVAHAQQVMKPFGLNAEADALPWAVQNLAPRHREVSDMVARALKKNSSPEEWRAFTKDVKGIGPAKSGFVASMLGRGDQPTLDARQVILQTGMSTSEAKKPMQRAGAAAVDRLAARQDAMKLRMPSDLEPFRQHLTHHAIWDAAGNEETTHDDVIRAMRGAKDGGRIGYADGGSVLNHPMAKAIMESLHGTSSDELVRKALEMSKETGFTRRGRDVIASDPRLSEAQPLLTDIKPTSKSAKLITPMQEMEARMAPKFNLMPSKAADIEQMQRERARLIPLVGDRTPAGTILTGLQGRNLQSPVNQQGGPDYMRSEFATGDDPSGWRSRLSASTRMQGAAMKAGDDDRPVYGAHVAMGIKAADSSHMMLHTLLQAIPSSKIKKSHIKEFDEEIRRKFPADTQFPMEWPGILNTKGVHDFFYNQPGKVKARPGKHVTEFVQNMDSVRWRSKGFPDVGAARFANVEPGLMAEPQLATGFSMTKLDPSSRRLQPNTELRSHGTYTHGMPGTYAGRLGALVPASEIWRDHLGAATTPTSVQHTLMTKMPAVDVDQRIVDLVKGAQEERMKRYGFKNGGAVVAQPTEAQKRVGNYKKHHISFQGLPISIENPKGSTRSGRAPNGQEWSVKMPYHYGYIKRTEGADGDHVDVCIGPYDTSGSVFIVDQKNIGSGTFDEHKVMLGFRTREEALDSYAKGFSDGKGRDRIGAVVRMTMPEFKHWLRHHDTKKPVRGQGHIDRALSISSMYTSRHSGNAG